MKLKEFKIISLECGYRLGLIGEVWHAVENETAFCVSSFKDGNVRICTDWKYNESVGKLMPNTPINYKTGMSCEKYKKHLLKLWERYKLAVVDLKKLKISEDFE